MDIDKKVSLINRKGTFRKLKDGGGEKQKVMLLLLN